MKVLLNLSLILLSACSTTIARDAPSQPPSIWTDQFTGEEQQCHVMDRSFVNEGERYAPSEEGPNNAYLSELMFSRLSEGRIPESVHFVTNVQEGRLLVTFLGTTTRKLDYKVDCQSGWYTLKRSRSGQYLGNGVVEKQYGQVSFFRIGENEELIVRILVDAEFNSMYIFNSDVKTEEWYLFRPVLKSENP